ncbi:MAG: hypothetical protein MI746_14655 [Pseudomonadales bacterium]|nr:hypothetical protein [Pseudomonadales bacterium]
MHKSPNRLSQQGFSLFELVVFIICVAIIYAVAANRFAQFPAAAERANFMSITAQIQSGMNLQSMEFAINGNVDQLQHLEAANPMDFMLEPPINYLGVFDAVDSARLERRSWYFDRTAGQLVYLVNTEQGVFLELDSGDIPTDEIRFFLSVQYSYENRRGQEFAEVALDEFGGPVDPTIRRRFRGILFAPVTPYRWDGAGIDLPEAAISGQAG